jgi:hypothetical protein
MKKILFVLTLITSSFIYAQELPKQPFADDLRTYNQRNLMNIDLGMTKKEVVKVMGGMQSIQTYTNRLRGEMTAWNIKYQLISNPYARDLAADEQGNSIEVLWYYTDNTIGKGQDNDKIVQKDLTPIILKNNSVIGLGWGFYTNYSKIHNINISIDNN